jgi:hypothetical protein
MQTTITTQPKTYGEREGVTLDLLKKFTKAGDATHGEVHQSWAYRGDCTETGDRRIRAAIGDEAYEHHHWDATAFNGGVIVVVPRWKFKEVRSGSSPGLPAEYYWAMKAISDPNPDEGHGVRPCTKKEIAAVVPETQALLAELPGLEYMHIKKLSFFSTGKRGKQWRKAPKDARFFRFAAGYGCVSIKEAPGN